VLRNSRSLLIPSPPLLSGLHSSRRCC
jgi:hypothetical protein